MQIRKAEFVKSSSKYQECPEDNLPEHALIGRSNVGKSSLLNCLTSRKNLAKTSQKPGKTRLINHFLINEEWYLVDLPGYGWAQASKEDRKQWKNMIDNYLTSRSNLQCVLLLIDIRHAAQKNDLQFIENMADKEVPFVIIFTKADKISKNQAAQNIAKYRKVLLKDWESMPTYFITSSMDSRGIDELLNYLVEINQQWES